MDHPLLVICGPTATGKTSLALRLADRYRGELISADSRQVYRGMDIGTGKDIPKGYRYQASGITYHDTSIGYYTDGSTKIWGYDLVDPRDAFSVAQYIEIARRIIEDIQQRNKLPILVGGTGLYLYGVIHGIETGSIPPDTALRKRLDEVAVPELQRELREVDPEVWMSLNQSDRSNPRRLIRKIEIALGSNTSKGVTMKGIEGLGGDGVLWIGLTIQDRKKLYQRIDTRVDARIEAGFATEFEQLGSARVMSETLGYKQWSAYRNGEVSQRSAIQNWKHAEHAYARRQMTWFKKNADIVWFDVRDSRLVERVTAQVDRWYTEK